jgi:hypothetical protein
MEEREITVIMDIDIIITAVPAEIEEITIPAIIRVRDGIITIQVIPENTVSRKREISINV